VRCERAGIVTSRWGAVKAGVGMARRSAPVKTYQRSEMLPECQLTKADLEHLVKLTAIPDTPPELISSHIGTSLDDGAIEASTLTDFLSHAELPPILDNLRISSQSAMRGISVQLGGAFSPFEVTGDDEVWTRGSFDRLRDFLRQKRRFEPPRTIFASTAFASLLIGTALVGLIQLTLVSALAYGLIAAVAGSFLLIRYLEWMAWPRRKGTHIYLQERRRLLAGMLTPDGIQILLAVIGILIALIEALRH